MEHVNYLLWSPNWWAGREPYQIILTVSELKSTSHKLEKYEELSNKLLVYYFFLWLSQVEVLRISVTEKYYQ